MAALLPSQQELERKLVADDFDLGAPEKRLLNFIKKDIAAGRGRLATHLTYDTTISLMATVAAATYENIEREQGRDLRALVRVLKECVGVKDVIWNAMHLYAAQACSSKQIKEIILEETGPFFYTGSAGNGNGSA